MFLGGADDLLEVEVRNKFSGTRPAFSRFLGKLTVPLVDLFGCQRNRCVYCVIGTCMSLNMLFHLFIIILIITDCSL